MRNLGSIGKTCHHALQQQGRESQPKMRGRKTATNHSGSGSNWAPVLLPCRITSYDHWILVAMRIVGRLSLSYAVIGNRTLQNKHDSGWHGFLGGIMVRVLTAACGTFGGWREEQLGRFRGQGSGEWIY